MGLITFFVVIMAIAIAITWVMIKFGTEDAPDWVEMDEYYRSRWYK